MHQYSEHERADFRRFSKLLTWAASLTFGLICLGSLVRASNSGLSCPDWPLCYGQAIPLFDTHIFLEWFHRVVAASLGCLMVTAGVKLMRSRLLRRPFALQLSTSAALLSIQIVLGGLTVLKLLDPATVSAHLINALLFFTVLVWMAMRAHSLATEPDTQEHIPTPLSIRIGFITATFLMFVQIGIGGTVSSRYAGLACPDFPTCNGSFMVPPNLPQALQMLHRGFALVLLIYTCCLSTFGSRIRLPSSARRAVRLVPLLVLVQIALGMINIYFSLPIWASALHLANAAALYSLLLLASIDLLAQRKGYHHGAISRHNSAAEGGKRFVAQLPTAH